MLVDLAALCGARPRGNSSERNQTKEDELGISSRPLLTLTLLLEARADIRNRYVYSAAVQQEADPSSWCALERRHFLALSEFLSHFLMVGVFPCHVEHLRKWPWDFGATVSQHFTSSTWVRLDVCHIFSQKSELDGWINKTQLTLTRFTSWFRVSVPLALQGFLKFDLLKLTPGFSSLFPQTWWTKLSKVAV